MYLREKKSMCVYAYTCINTHTHIHIQPLDQKLAFPSQDPCTSKWKMLRKQSKWQTKLLCSLVIQYAAPFFLTHCTEWLTTSFPLFFWSSSLQRLKRLNKHEEEEATCDSYIPPQERDVQRLLTSACTLHYTGWMTSKENWKSIG